MFVGIEFCVTSCSLESVQTFKTALLSSERKEKEREIYIYIYMYIYI
jgi:hypothetical protein